MDCESLELQMQALAGVRRFAAVYHSVSGFPFLLFPRYRELVVLYDDLPTEIQGKAL